MTTAELSADYLERVNWKTILEYLTAEVILNRPVDPIRFAVDVLQNKLNEKITADDEEGAAITPKDVNMWTQKCYSDASARADENGVISE
jgi:hypothetical protein